ncbi:DUF2846 domain-containing protein [Hyalangium versicolor]|uniref:DUF2846 domain-containing protein n=1 Tax=Hyalangium versicolor TaxID=2861190 RepID=UPI001CC9BD33|nr:DUF2846 domain-containing protein [Hyalangium versicolor]
MTENAVRGSRVRGVAQAALLLAVLFHAVGCARVPLARREEDERAKVAKPQPHTSLLYLYRNESFGGAILMTIEMDGRRVGETAPDTYFLWELPPGEHVITASNGLNDRSTLVVNTAAGATHYIWQEVKWGALMARPFLQEVEAKEGAEAIKECQLVRAFYAPEDLKPRPPSSGIIQAHLPADWRPLPAGGATSDQRAD